MLSTDDDLTPQKQPKKPRDLSSFSVDDLAAYIAALASEQARAEGELERKKAYRDAVGGFFGGGGKTKTDR